MKTFVSSKSIQYQAVPTNTLTQRYIPTRIMLQVNSVSRQIKINNRQNPKNVHNKTGQQTKEQTTTPAHPSAFSPAPRVGPLLRAAGPAPPRVRSRDRPAPQAKVIGRPTPLRSRRCGLVAGRAVAATAYFGCILE